MKHLLVLTAVLAVARVCDSMAQTVQLGAISDGDVLLHRSILFAPAMDGFQTADLMYQGNSSVTVGALIATPIGFVERPLIATVINGGIGLNAVQFRLMSNRGYGLNFILDVWGQ